MKNKFSIKMFKLKKIKYKSLLTRIVKLLKTTSIIGKAG